MRVAGGSFHQLTGLICPALLLASPPCSWLVAVGSQGPLPARDSPATRGALGWPQRWQAPARSDAERKSPAFPSLNPTATPCLYFLCV